MRFHRPADDAPTPNVEDDRQRRHSRPHRDVRDVRPTVDWGAGGGEFAAYQSRRLGVFRPLRCHRLFAATDAAQAGLLEQAGKTRLGPTRHTVGAQVAVKAGRAVGATRCRLKRPDLVEQPYPHIVVILSSRQPRIFAFFNS
jgi:hypothetical protein